MNRKFKFVIAILFLLLAAYVKLPAVEKSKEYHESWPAQSVELLEINNKFGEVKVINDGSGNLTIDVVITVEASGAMKAEELLNLVNVSFNQTGSSVSARTNMSDDFESRNKFSIDYEVNIPSDKNLNITNKYGNVFVNVLNANGIFDIQYGNFTANQLNAPEGRKIEMNLGYGKADIGSGNDIYATIQYSSINFGQLGDLTLNTKYTVINLEGI